MLHYVQQIKVLSLKHTEISLYIKTDISYVIKKEQVNYLPS